MSDVRIPLPVALSLRDALTKLDANAWTLKPGEDFHRAIGHALSTLPFLSAAIEQQTGIIESEAA